MSHENQNSTKNPEIIKQLPGGAKEVADEALDMTTGDPTDRTVQLQNEVEAFLADSDFSYEKYGFQSPTEIIERNGNNPRQARAFIQSRRANPETPAAVKLADERYLRAANNKARNSAASNEYLQTLLNAASETVQEASLNPVVEPDNNSSIPLETPDEPQSEMTATPDVDTDDSSTVPAVRLKPVTNANTGSQQPNQPATTNTSPSGNTQPNSPTPDTPAPAVRLHEVADVHEVMDDKFVEDFLSESAKLDQQRAAIQALRNKRDPLSKYQYQKAVAELKGMEEAFQKRFFAGVDMKNAAAVEAHEVKIGRAIEESNERKIDTVAQMREIVAKESKDLDALIKLYKAQTDPAKADVLWSQLEQAHAKYNENAAEFNLKNNALAGLIGTALFEAMDLAADVTKDTVRSDTALRTEDARLLHTPTTSAEKKATARAAKADAKKERKHDIEVLKKAVKKIPDWFSPVDDSDNPQPGTSKSDSDREKQWNKLLKNFHDESCKYVQHERGDALGSAYQIAYQLERKWRNRDNFERLKVADKAEYQKDMDRLLHDHDGFVWKVLGSNKINARDLSISDLYQVISRAEFKNTLRESRTREIGGLALIFATVPSGLYQSSVALLTSVYPGANNLYWFINETHRQYTIDSLSNRTARGLGLNSTPASDNTTTAA